MVAGRLRKDRNLHEAVHREYCTQTPGRGHNQHGGPDFFSLRSHNPGYWLSVGSMQSLSQVTAVLAVMAFGEAIVIATGEIDISVGSVSGIGALAFLGLAPVVGSGLALLGALACGILIGAMNGVFVALLGLPSLLVTLGTLFLFQGIGYAVTSGFSFAATDSVRQQWIYNAVGNSGVAGVNAGVIWALVVLVVLQLVLFETPVGNRILAVGGDAASSFSRGVNVTKIKFGVFVVSGLLAAFAGVLDAAFIGYADGSFGVTMELSAIAAAVLGGCHLAGGRISLIGTLFGAFILRGIQSFLIILGVQPQWYILVVGLIVVFASLADRTLTRLATK
jgi:ribose transport system permease protein